MLMFFKIMKLLKLAAVIIIRVCDAYESRQPGNQIALPGSSLKADNESENLINNARQLLLKYDFITTEENTSIRGRITKWRAQ